MDQLSARPASEVRQQVVSLVTAARSGLFDGDDAGEVAATLGGVIHCELGRTAPVWPGMTAEELQAVCGEFASLVGADIIGQATTAVVFAVRLFLALAERYAEDFPEADIDGFLREAGLVAAAEDPG